MKRSKKLQYQNYLDNAHYTITRNSIVWTFLGMKATIKYIKGILVELPVN